MQTIADLKPYQESNQLTLKLLSSLYHSRLDVLELYHRKAMVPYKLVKRGG